MRWADSLDISNRPPVRTIRNYVRSTNPKDPVLSPVYADLTGLPPTLFITSERDLLLSGTTILHRAFLNAGVDAHLIVFEGLPHAFWNNVQLARDARSRSRTWRNSSTDMWENKGLEWLTVPAPRDGRCRSAATSLLE